MKYIFILSAIFMLASCQHKSSKEKAKEYWNNNQFELALIEISDAIKEHPVAAFILSEQQSTI